MKDSPFIGLTEVCFMFFIITHALSRLTAISIIFTTDYVREDELSKIKPMNIKINIQEIGKSMKSIILDSAKNIVILNSLVHKIIAIL